MNIHCLERGFHRAKFGRLQCVLKYFSNWQNDIPETYEKQSFSRSNERVTMVNMGKSTKPLFSNVS